MHHPTDNHYPWHKLAFLFGSVLPTCWVISLYMLAVRARLILGYWPSYGRPDPKDLAAANDRFATLYHWQAAASTLTIVSIGPMLPLMLFLWFRDAEFRSKRLYRVAAVLYLTGYAAFWLVLKYDPGEVWNWFID